MAAIASRSNFLSRPVTSASTYFGIRDAIRNHGPNPVSPAQALAVMAVLETAIESSNSGRALPLPLTEAEQARWHDSLARSARTN